MTKVQLKAKIKELVLADREAERLSREPKSIGWQVVVDAEVKVEMLKKAIFAQIDVMYQGADENEDFTSPARDVHWLAEFSPAERRSIMAGETTGPHPSDEDGSDDRSEEEAALDAFDDVVRCQHCDDNLDGISFETLQWHHYKGCVSPEVDAEFESSLIDMIDSRYE